MALKHLEGNELVLASAAIAEELHDGQKHFFGDGTYFERHLQPVAHIVERLGYGALYIAGAYLHDVKEDTPVTDEELISKGIPTRLVHSLNLLAKTGQPHEEYLDGILSDPIATVDKFADSSFNFSWTILNSPQIKDTKFREWGLEYANNLAILRSHLPPTDN